MKHLACAFLVVLAVQITGTGQDSKKEDAKPPEPLTKDWLVGKWRHPENASITLWFRKDGDGFLQQVAFVNGMFSQTSLGFDYVIDEKAGVVKMDQGKSHVGTAERVKGGKLLVTAKGNFINKVSFERVKEADPKKEPKD